MKKAIVTTLLIACFVGMAVAADTHSYSAARPGVVAGPKIPVHQFISRRGMQQAGASIFTSDYEDNAVWWYDTKGDLLGTITNNLLNPQGLVTDAKNNLYVADTGNSNLLIYAKPYTKTPKTLDASGWYPVGISQFNNGEWVAAANIFATNGDAGSVLIYRYNKLVRTITNSSFFEYYFCAFDSKGNLFVDGRDDNGNTILGVVLSATAGGSTLKVISTGNTIEFPGGIAVNASGQVAIDDQDASTVYTYNGLAHGSLGNPIKTTPLSGVGDGVNFAFMGGGKTLWVADAVNLNLTQYNYPKGGSSINTITPSGAGLLIGVAVTPALAP
ncbi:MAG TPA: hypothetical protein VF753_15235 [Terriglobales bacterium]